MKSSETRTPCILVADDQADVLEALRFLIKGEGYQAVAVNSPPAVINEVESRDFDAVLMPTVAVVPPRIADLAEKQAYLEQSALVTRLTSIANCLDRCAVSLPCSKPGSLPVGFTLMGEHGADRALLATALAVESVIDAGIAGRD